MSKKRIIYMIFFTIMLFSVVIGCGESRLSLNGIVNFEAYSDAVKVIQQEYPNVKIISTEDDATIENISNKKSERRFGVTIVVDEDGKQQAILIELVYSGDYYGDDTQYRIVLKTDVDYSIKSSEDTAVILAPNTSMSKEQLYYLAVKTVAKYYDVSEIELLLDSNFPGVDKCGVSGAKDGGTYFTLPILNGESTILISCEIYEDRTCVINGIEEITNSSNNEKDKQDNSSSTVKESQDTQKTQQTKESSKSLLDQMIDDVDSIYLPDKYNLDLLTKDELRILRNSIYAKHGYIFKDENLSKYFEKKSFYKPTVTKENWDDSVLTDVEIRNKDIILAYEKSNEEAESNESDESDDDSSTVSLKQLFDCIIDENDTERPYDTIYEGEYEAVGYYVLDDYDECIKKGLKAEYIVDRSEVYYEVYMPGMFYNYDEDEEEVTIIFNVYFSDGEPYCCEYVGML